jgi:hypothetical protein
LVFHYVWAYRFRNTCFEGLELIMTQAQAGMQECLVVFARSVEVLHQPPKARAIEVQKRSPNVAPSWRGILATDHGHEPFDEGFVRELLGSLKIRVFRKGAD